MAHVELADGAGTLEAGGVPTPAARAAGGGHRPARIWAVLERWGTFAAFLAIFVAYVVWLGGNFLHADARLIDVHQSVPLALLGLAALMTLLAGQFDLSIASMAAVTSFFTIGLSTRNGWPFGAVIVLCLAIGVLGGLVNGFLVVRLNINAFIATLGSGGIFLGISAVYSGGSTLAPLAQGTQLPGWFAGAGSLGDFRNKPPAVLIWLIMAGATMYAVWSTYRRRHQFRHTWAWYAGAAGVVVAAVAVGVAARDWFTDISWMTIVLFAVTIFLWLLIQHTTFGRHLRATGSNPVAARLAGVPTTKITVVSFVAGAVLAALAGITMGSTQGSASPGTAQSLLLSAFAAAFLSTVILSTGAFHVWGSVIGAIFLVWVSAGLIVAGINFTWTTLVDGVVLVFAVAVSTIFKRRT